MAPAMSRRPLRASVWLTGIKQIWLTPRSPVVWPAIPCYLTLPITEAEIRPPMAKSKPLRTPRPTSEDARALIASAVRTLEAEAGGITALAAAIHDGLGRSFTAAVDLIRGARGRVIVT